jgi:hypothetical protein
LLLVKRFGRLSVGRSRVRVVASAVGEIGVAGIAADEIAADGTRPRVRLLAVTLADVIRGWIRCGSGLLLVARGRVLRTTRSWI